MASATAHLRPPLTAAAQRTVLVGMLALVSLGAFEALAVATAMPTAASALHGLTLYTVAFAGTLATSIVGMVAGGRWSDQIGPTRPLRVGVGLFLVGLLVAGAAQTMGMLVVGRMFQGAGTGLYSVALFVLVARVFPEDRRPKVFAAFAAAWVVPSVVGPVVAGLTVEHLGWRWVFLAVPVLAVPALALLRPGLHAGNGTRLGDTSTSDRTSGSAVWWAAGSGTAIMVVNVAGQLRGAALAVGLAVGIAGIVACVPRLMPPGSLRAAHGLPGVMSVRGLVTASFVGAEVLLPLLLSTERGLSPAVAGVVLTFGAVGWAVGSAFRSRTAPGWAPTSYLRLGGAVLALGIAGTALLAWSAVPSVVGMAAWTAAGFGMGVLSPTLTMLTLELSPVARHGANSSALQVADAAAGATALAVTGSLLWALHVALGTSAYVVCIAVATTAAALAVLLAPRVRLAGAPGWPGDHDDPRLDAAM